MANSGSARAICWRVEGVELGQIDVEFEGRIDTAEDFGDGLVRMSGALTSGSRFVLVTDDSRARELGHRAFRRQGAAREYALGFAVWNDHEVGRDVHVGV